MRHSSSKKTNISTFNIRIFFFLCWYLFIFGIKWMGNSCIFIQALLLYSVNIFPQLSLVCTVTAVMEHISFIGSRCVINVRTIKLRCFLVMFCRRPDGRRIYSEDVGSNLRFNAPPWAAVDHTSLHLFGVVVLHHDTTNRSFTAPCHWYLLSSLLIYLIAPHFTVYYTLLF